MTSRENLPTLYSRASSSMSIPNTLDNIRPLSSSQGVKWCGSVGHTDVIGTGWRLVSLIGNGCAVDVSDGWPPGGGVPVTSMSRG